MKNSSNTRAWAIPGFLLLLIGSALAILSSAQGSQDQNEASAILSMNATYTADVKAQQNGSPCTDHLTLTYSGSAHYQLLPSEMSTNNFDPEILTTLPRGGVQSERTGNFSIQVQGGGSCAGKGGSMVWKYFARPDTVPPNQFPSIAVRLRLGDYRVDKPDLTTFLDAEGQINVGGGSIPFAGPQMAVAAYARLVGHSLQKVSDALHGPFPPYSKGFSRSNSVTDSIEINNPDSQGTASLNISYTLTVGNPEEVEAILIPQDGYEQWMPEGGPDEDSPGNTLTVKVVLQKAGKPGSKTAEKAQFKFELEKVSKEPGVCLNWPPKSRVKNPPDFDLKIVQQQDPENPENPQNMLLESVAKDGQSAKSRPMLSEAELTITSYDYGAWGKLKVTAVLDDPQHTQVVAHLQNRPDVTELTVPQDDNENHVADTFERTYNPPNADDEYSDRDGQPDGDGTPGDGLSLYEEYRGFMVGSEDGHIRTDPTRKDIFVRNRGLLPMDLFLLSNLSIHEIGPDEYARDDSGPNPAYINFNTSGFGNLGPQHVLRLINKQLGDDGLLGVTGASMPGPPGAIEGGWVRVDKAECLSSKWGRAELLTTVAHELAHGCNVSHHGGPGYTGVCFFSYDAQGQPHPVDPNLYGEISVKGGVHSGDKDCIMRYEGTDFTQSASAADLLSSTLSWQIYDSTAANNDPRHLCSGLRLRGAYWNSTLEKTAQDIPEAPGASFCTSKAGRPFPKPGDATQGDCQHKFCINDNATCSFVPQ